MSRASFLSTTAMSVSTALLGLCLLLYLLGTLELLQGELQQYFLNLLISIVVFVQGVNVVYLVWRLEVTPGLTAIPFAWSFLAIQHLFFGMGGLLVSISNQNYFYENAQGYFAWSGSIVPFLFAHAVSLNIGLLGVWLALGRRNLRRVAARTPREGQSLWQKYEGICYSSLAIHGLIWMVLLNLNLPDLLMYVARALSEVVNAAFMLWGLAWRTCPRKPVFLAYVACFVGLQIILGSRSDAFIPILLFGMGYLIARPDQSWNLGIAIRWAPVAFFVAWGMIASEDLRSQFRRGVIEDTSDAAARIETLATGSVESRFIDASGAIMNPAFRLGARCFELSAADVISRTPDSVPFRGWSSDDTDILLTGFLPLKFNSDAAYNTDPEAGVLFLHNYGWENVDPTRGNSMPATMVADSWRRFGWAGIIAVYFIWSWLLAKATRMMKSWRNNFIFLVFACCTTAAFIIQYTDDITTHVYIIPRRLAVAAIVTGIFWVCSLPFGRNPESKVVQRATGPLAALRMKERQTTSSAT